MLFEVQDLCVASPATVSRLGMVYMDSQELGWPATVQTWLDKYEGMQEATKDLLKTFFDTFVAKALYFCRKNLREPVDTVDVQKVCTILNLITRIIESEEQIDLSANAEVLHPLITQVFFFSFCWGVGGPLGQRDWETFDSYARDLFEDVREIKVPGAATVFDVYVNLEKYPEKESEFSMWDTIVPKFEYNPEVPFFEILVPTVTTVRYSWLFRTLALHDIHAGIQVCAPNLGNLYLLCLALFG